MFMNPDHSHIRRANEGDLPAILTLLESAGLYTSSVTMNADVTYLLAQEQPEQSVGVIGMEHGAGASLLRSFTVRQDRRGRGYSLRLLAAAYGVMRERGDQDIYLFSADEGSFWQRQGYHPTTPQDIARRLPRAPQVQSALNDGWLEEGLAWHRPL